MAKKDTIDNGDAERLARDMVEAAEPDAGKKDDGLTPSERDIEAEKQQERIRKAQTLKKQLRKRELGLVKYRWPAAILILSGALAISTEFLVVMEHPPGIGFDTFWQIFLDPTYSDGFFIFPVVAGALMIICGVLGYSNPRATWFSAIAAMMMFMSGATVYFLITFAVTVDPEAEISATGTPLTMIIVGVLALVSIALREKE